MSEPLPLSERLKLIAELDADHPPPHPSLPETPVAGSNVAYLSKVENDQLLRQAMVLGLGRFQAR